MLDGPDLDRVLIEEKARRVLDKETPGLVLVIDDTSLMHFAHDVSAEDVAMKMRDYVIALAKGRYFD